MGKKGHTREPLPRRAAEQRDSHLPFFSTRAAFFTSWRRFFRAPPTAGACHHVSVAPAARVACPVCPGWPWIMGWRVTPWGPATPAEGGQRQVWRREGGPAYRARRSTPSPQGRFKEVCTARCVARIRSGGGRRAEVGPGPHPKDERCRKRKPIQTRDVGTCRPFTVVGPLAGQPLRLLCMPWRCARRVSACSATDRPPGGEGGGRQRSLCTLTHTLSAAATAPAVARPASSGGPATPSPRFSSPSSRRPAAAAAAAVGGGR